MANEWKIEAVNAEVLTRATAAPARVEAVSAEVLTRNPTTPAIVESLYAEVLMPKPTGYQAAIDTGHATARGYAPTVNLGAKNIGIGTGHATGQGYAPTVSIAARNIVIGTGHATAQGHTPSMSLGSLVIPLDTGHATADGSAPTVTFDHRVHGWDADESQQATLQFAPDELAGPLTVLPPIAVAPDAVPTRPLLRVSHILPALTADPATHRVRADGMHDVINEVVGDVHVFVGGRDVTYFRDAPTRVGALTASLPGGDETASIDFPQLSPWDVPGQGDLTWLKADAPVEVYIVKDGVRVGPPLFCGHLVSDNPGHSETDLQSGWHVEGTIAQADHQGHRVPTMLDPAQDIGRLIPMRLNSVISRRYSAIRGTLTGILTRNRGSYTDSEWDYVQALLSTAWTADGRQWTIARTSSPRGLRLQLKDTTTEHWTLAAGTPGLTENLTKDQSEVVHAIYGRGVGPDGYAWAGWVYPNLHADTAPAYPYSSAGAVMSIGSTDAGTSTGEGVSTWQERARQLGYRLATDGVFSSADADTARAIQERYGLLVDGVVGPQTWAATFAVGANAGSLDGAYRRPIAVDTRVEPSRTGPDGGYIGPNPAYDPSIVRRELDIDYGAGVKKAEATVSAKRQIARDADPGWTGSLTLKTDPRQGSRFLMFEGQNVRLLGHRGSNPLLHIVETSKDPHGDEQTVTLTVDSKARDAMTLASIRERDRESRNDPGRRPGSVSRRSRLEQDMVVEFDGESGAGVIPRHALYGGLWTVIRIPVSQAGRIAKVAVTTSGPASRFALALFGAPIQPSHLVRYVGNPLAKDSPFSDHADVLEDRFGFIEGWGQQGSAAGYYPKEEGKGPVTGRLVDTGALEYVSQKAPWVWVAEYAASSCFISGRIYPAPVD